MTIRYWIIQNFIPKSTKKKIEIITYASKIVIIPKSTRGKMKSFTTM